MPICNEDIATVFAGLRATCESLAATGALKLFDVYVLSDTTDPALRAAELRAWERLRSMLGDAQIGQGARMFYRWPQACAPSARPATSPTSAGAGAATTATWSCSTPTA